MREIICGITRCGIHWEMLLEGTEYAAKCCMTGVTPSRSLPGTLARKLDAHWQHVHR
jgi:hypothetical protein